VVAAEIDEARDRMARMFGVRTDELHFGPSTAGNVYVLARAFWEVLAPGSTIIVSDQDHEANSGPWRRLADFGIRVLPWTMDPETGRLDPAELERMLDPSVRLVCFPHCSSVIGEINPVAEITALVRRAGALSCVDGAAFAPHEIPNLHRIGADIYLISAHKLFGPHVGIMVVRRAVAGMLRYQGPDDFAQPLVRRLLPASEDHPQIAACAGIADYVDALYSTHFKAGRDATGRGAAVSEMMAAQEQRLLDPLVAFLAQRPGVRVLGPLGGGTRVALVSFTPAYSRKSV
jgi:selenocysteine lyase/cysteine desulfurase